MCPTDLLTVCKSRKIQSLSYRQRSFDSAPPVEKSGKAGDLAGLLGHERGLHPAVARNQSRAPHAFNATSKELSSMQRAVHDLAHRRRHIVSIRGGLGYIIRHVDLRRRHQRGSRAQAMRCARHPSDGGRAALGLSSSAGSTNILGISAQSFASPSSVTVRQ